jgi:GH24 family phage-related lysozyme (muramidase)
MKAYLTILLLAFACLPRVSAQTAEQFRSYIDGWEGYTHVPYYRANGERSTGIGHNTSGDVWQTWYTDADIERYYQADYARALDACRSAIDHFDDLPYDAKLVVMSVCWTVGRRGLYRFVSFRFALDQRNYKAAATALFYSKWALQVGRARLTDHLARLRSCALSP